MQNAGISNGGNLEDDYLDAIYDRIKANAISLKEDDDLRARQEQKELSDALNVFGSNPAEKRWAQQSSN